MGPSGGLLGGLLSTGQNLGTAAIAADAATKIGKDIVGIFNNPVNLAIAAAAVGGVLFLTSRR